MSLLNILENRLNLIKNLEENWDGYGASIISPEVIENTITFLNTLGERSDIEEDDITPTPYGSIVVDLPKVSIEIGKKKIGWFSLNDDLNDSMGEDTDFINLPEKLKELL